MISTLQNKRRRADEFLGDENTFEMIPPMVDPLTNLEEIPSVATSAEFPSKPKRSASASMKPLIWMSIAMAAMILTGMAYHQESIKALRLEYKRDLESLRSDVEQGLGINFSPAAAVQSVARERETKAVIQDNKNPNYSIIDRVRSAVKPGNESPSVDSSEKAGDEHENQNIDEVRSEVVNIANNLSDGISANILLALESIDDTFHRLLESSHDTMDTITCKLQSMNLAATSSSISPRVKSIPYAINNTIQELSAFQMARHAIHLACQHGLEFGFWLFVFYILLCSGCFFRGGRDTKDHKTSKMDGIKQDSDEISEDGYADGNPDDSMEDMFQDAVAAAGISPVIPRSQNSYHSISGANTYVEPFIRSPPRPRPPTPPRALSKQERLRLARANARLFGERDKQKLAARKSGSSSKASVSTEDAVVQSPIARGSPSIRTPSSTKKARLQQARANAKAWGEWEKQQRLKKSARRRLLEN